MVGHYDSFFCFFLFVFCFVLSLWQVKLEALRERRPPCPRQIITLILPTVKMLSLGCERLPTLLKKKKKKKKKRFWIITCTTIWVCYRYYGDFLLIYSSYSTQITTKI